MSSTSRKFRIGILQFSSVALRLSSLIAFLVGGCGTETGNPITNRPKTPRLLAQDTTEAELQEVADSVIDSGVIPPTPTAGSYLQNISSSAPLLLRSLTCTGDKNKVTGQVNRKIEEKKRFPKLGTTLTRVIERTQTFKIESPLGALSCSEETGVHLRPRLLDGTTETREGSSKRTVSRSGNIRPGWYTSAEFYSSGKRTKKFERLTEDATTIRVERTVEWNLEKKNRISTTEGESSDSSSSFTVVGKPIRILLEIAEDEGTKEKTRTIQSGATVTTRADGSKVEISFENLVFATQKCYPTSGFLRGRITPSGSSGSKMEEFSIDFSNNPDEVPEIVFADGEKLPLSGNCID